VLEKTVKNKINQQRERIITDKNEEISDLSGIVMASDKDSSNTGNTRALLLNIPGKPEISR